MKPLNSITIIGGKYRGKKLSFPSSPHLRPTKGQIKETLFNWLMHDIHGASCLDAFAGSGSLGWEAVSRGAKEVDMVEQSFEVYQHLCNLAKQFPHPHLHVYHQDILLYFTTMHKKYDIIFLDPPFQQSLLPLCIQLILTHSCLQSNGLLYLEAPTLPEVTSLNLLKSSKTGKVHYALYQRQAP